MIVEYPRFEKLRIDHINDISSIIKTFPPYSDFNFVSLFSYDIDGFCEISLLNNNLVVKYGDYITGEPFFTFIGNNRIVDTVNTLIYRCKDYGIKTELNLLPEDCIKKDIPELESKYDLFEDENNHDYVLSVKSMIELGGKDLKTKRSRINSFKQKYPNHEVKLINISQSQVQEDIHDLFCKWANYMGKTDEDTIIEMKALTKLQNYAFNFNLVSLGIYDEEKLIAFSINEVVHDRYYMAHFGKYDKTYTGIFPYMEHVTAIQMSKFGCEYMNYEQDMGLPGLREAKKGWKPVFYLKKYTLTIKK